MAVFLWLIDRANECLDMGAQVVVADLEAVEWGDFGGVLFDEELADTIGGCR